VKADRDPLDEKAISAVRAHFEEDVAEARLRFRAPRLAGRPVGGRAGNSNRSAWRVIASLAVVSLAIVAVTTLWVVVRTSPATGGPTASPSQAAAAVTTASPGASPTASPSPSATPSTAPSGAAPSGSAPNYLQGIVGLNGSAAWVLSGSGLSLSQDGGQSWSSLALPNGVKSSSVLAVSAVAGRAVWLAVNGSAGVLMYRKQGTDDWTSATPLVPSWATASELSGQPVQSVILTPGPTGLVTVAETIGLGMSTAAEALFVSTDDGHTYAQHPPKAPVSNSIWASVTFVKPQSGVIVAGPGTAPHEMQHTSDGGNTWSNAAVTGLPADGNYQLGPSLLVGSDIEVPVTTFTSAGGTNTTFFLLISHDGGATFAPAGTAIPSGGNFYPAFDSLGQVTWVQIVGGGLRETADGGQTWTTVTAAGLPVGVTSIQLTGPTSATAVVQENGCTGVKTGCYSRTYLVATTDGGATWGNLQP
jgi:hypothetical protein